MAELITDQVSPATAEPAAWQRYVPLLAWIIVIGTVLMIPLKIIGYGYLPVDDALRHAAQGVSGKDWSQVLVLREPLKVDFQFGWDLIQRLLHRWFGLDAEGLVELSILSLFLLVNASVLSWLKRPEAWLGAFLINGLAGNLPGRFFFGRPYLITMSALLTILMAWRVIGSTGLRARDFGWITAVIGVACFVHGTWYLWALLVMSFLLARQFRWAIAVGGGWLLGAVLAAIATGHPWEYLTSALHVAISSTGSFTTQALQATELQPKVNYDPLLVIGALLAARRLAKARWRPLTSDPAFWLVCLGWILGCRTGRFWSDWGTAGMLALVTSDLQTLFESGIVWDSANRLICVAGISLAAFTSTTADVNSRWTDNLHDQYLVQGDPNLEGWLPDDGGVIYSASMDLFYQTYFKNPNAPWRYIVGFEPTLMPADDLEVYQHIIWNYGDDGAYDGWVKKMQPADRLIISIGGQPRIPALQWKHAVGRYWIGRLPRTNEPALTEPKAEK